MLELRLLGGLELFLDDGARATCVIAQPKRVALLIYLALAQPRGFHRRDSLLPLFWPEADERHARRALNQALHHLRGGLNPALIVTRDADGVGLDAGRYRCDAIELRSALAAGKLEHALALYHGALLPGFHVQASNEFGEWLDTERRSLHDAITRAAEDLSRRASDTGDDAAAVHWARRACELAPLGESCAQLLISALVRAGDEAGARGEFDRFAERLHRELGVEPSAPTKACLSPAPRLAAPNAPAAASRLVAEREPAPPRRVSRKRRVAALAITAGLVGAALYAAAAGVRTPGVSIHVGGPSARPVVLIGDLVDPDSDTLLGDVATQLFVSALRDSRSVRTTWSGEVGDALARMQRPRTTPVRGAVAREIAVRDGYGAVLDGSVRNVNGELLLTVTLMDPTSGHVMAAHAASIHDARALTGAVDSIARSLRRLVGDSAQAIARARPLASVTTPSLEALRAFTEALRLFRVEDMRGIAQLERAVSLDTGFASAYRILGAMLWWHEQPERSSNMLLAAMRHADRLSESEREITQAVLYSRGRYYDAERAMAAFDGILDRDSTNLSALANETWLLDEQRKYERAVQLGERALRASDSTLRSMFGTLAVLRWNLGDSSAARRTIDSGIRRSPMPELRQVRAWMYSAEGRMDSAAAELWRARDAAKPADRDRVSVAITQFQASNARRLGHLAEARRFDEEGVAAARRLHNARMEFVARMPAIEEALRARGDRAAAIARLADLQRLTNLISYPDRPAYELAGFYADAGRPDVAARLILDADRHFPPGEWEEFQPVAHRTRAHLALAERRYADAVREFRQGEYGHCDNCTLPWLSLAYERAGMIDSAIAVGERALARPDLRTAISAGIDFPELHRRLAALNLGRGDMQRAERHLSAFIGLWADADRELQPQVDAARRQRDELRQRRVATQAKH